MYVRTQKVRKSLRKLLEEEKGTPGTWNVSVEIALKSHSLISAFD